MLDNTNTISPLQSQTVLSAIKAMVPQIVLILTQITGKVFDVDTINNAINDGYSLIASGISLFYIVRAIKGRINATQAIKKT